MKVVILRQPVHLEHMKFLSKARYKFNYYSPLYQAEYRIVCHQRGVPSVPAPAEPIHFAFGCISESSRLACTEVHARLGGPQDSVHQGEVLRLGKASASAGLRLRKKVSVSFMLVYV